jgi:hypothetical protein
MKCCTHRVKEKRKGIIVIAEQKGDELDVCNTVPAIKLQNTKALSL